MEIRIIFIVTDLLLSREIFLFQSLSMENVFVYKMRTYFREVGTEKGSGLAYIQSVQKFTSPSSK